MIKYLRCYVCKTDEISEIRGDDQTETVWCKECNRSIRWWSMLDLSDQEWAQEKIAEWVADRQTNNAPKFFDEDGDPTMELSNSIYDMEHYAYAKIKHFVDKGMNKLELRAFAERLINAVQMAALTYMPHIPRSEK